LQNDNNIAAENEDLGVEIDMDIEQNQALIEINNEIVSEIIDMSEIDIHPINPNYNQQQVIDNNPSKKKPIYQKKEKNQ